ncbi:MAG: hypothetical protein IJD16_04135 [Desulfovibrio sp.]|nr:hypothetical protein [Desulfovibrio sp.]
MLKPFYQGKLDTFCAIYAVLNALRLTHGIRVSKARDILNESLLALASTPEAFRAVLEQTTDYLHLVDGLLRLQSRAFPLEVRKPFAGLPAPTEEELWQACRQWLIPNAKRAVVFRFTRCMTPDLPPVSRHWTTADRMNDSILHLFDSSHEAEAILNIRKDSFVTVPEAVTSERLLYIQPESMRFLRLPF